MGLTNVERQRLWRKRHAVEVNRHIQQLKLAHPSQRRKQDTYRSPKGNNGANVVIPSSTAVLVRDVKRSNTLGDNYEDATSTVEGGEEGMSTWLDTAVQSPLPTLRMVEESASSRFNPSTTPKLIHPNMPRSLEKREKDALRYLVLCVDNPRAFRHAIDSVPDSSIRRVCDAVLNATKGDAKRKLTPAQRALCNKYKRSIDILVSPKKSLKTKRSLLRSARKQVGGSVFVPMLVQAAFDTLGSALIPPATKHL
jgi:hypothetical protein